MIGSRIWIFVLAIIALVLQAVLATLAIIALIGFGLVGLGGLGIALLIIPLALIVVLIVLYAFCMARIKNNRRNKGNAITIIIICTLLLVLSFIAIDTWWGGTRIFFSISWFDLINALLGLAIGIGSLATLKKLDNVTPKAPRVAPNPGYGQPGAAPQYHNPYQQAQQPPVQPPPVGQYHNPYHQAPPAASQRPPISNEELKKELVALKSLMDDGLITQEEFDKRKSVLLSQLP